MITGMIAEILHLQNLIWSLCRTNHFTITKMGEEYWFILRDVPENELAFIKLQSDIEYIAMMSEIEL